MTSVEEGEKKVQLDPSVLLSIELLKSFSLFLSVYRKCGQHALSTLNGIDFMTWKSVHTEQSLSS